jgi:hypothetical protein
MDLPGDFTGACWRPSFYIGAPYPGSWWAGQRTREFRQMVEAAGGGTAAAAGAPVTAPLG